MRTVTGLLVLGVASMAACDAGAPKPDCMLAVHRVVAAARPSSATPHPKTEVTRSLIARRCVDDQWSAAATTCLGNARSSTAILECRHQHLTGAQDEALATLLDSLQDMREEVGATAIVAMNDFRAQMCACTDSTCAQQIAEATSQWSKEHMRPNNFSDEDARRVTEIGVQITECMLKTMNNSDDASCDEVACVLNNYEGACCARFRRGTRTQPTSDDDMLTRADISEAVGAVKPAIMECGDKTPAKGKVKVKVKVGPDGHVSSVSVDTSPDPALGACVAAAMRKATFRKTAQGGSFSYPFMF